MRKQRFHIAECFEILKSLRVFRFGLFRLVSLFGDDIWGWRVVFEFFFITTTHDTNGFLRLTVCIKAIRGLATQLERRPRTVFHPLPVVGGVASPSES